jgi:uracil-DNA glycosylase family 4
MQASLFQGEPARSGETLEDIYKEELERGKLMFANRQFVFGTGNEKADVVVIGESPGHPDELYGRPFMGPAGELLVRILSSIGLTSNDCYLTNTVKIISQGTDITPEVLSFFVPFLRREIHAINPKLIIALGATPTKALLGTKKPISQVRGEFFEFEGIPLIPTFNPAYLLRDATKKKEVSDDMKKVREFLGNRR